MLSVAITLGADSTLVLVLLSLAWSNARSWRVCPTRIPAVNPIPGSPPTPLVGVLEPSNCVPGTDEFAGARFACCIFALEKRFHAQREVPGQIDLIDPGIDQHLARRDIQLVIDCVPDLFPLLRRTLDEKRRLVIRIGMTTVAVTPPSVARPVAPR